MKVLRIGYLLAMVLFINSVGLSQKSEIPKVEYFRIPSDLAFTLFSTREDTPIVFESAFLYATADGKRVVCNCGIRNVSAKPIRTLEIEVMTNFMFSIKGGGRLERYTEEVEFGEESSALQPKALIPSRDYLPSTKETLSKAFISNIIQQPSSLKAKFIVAIMVRRVEFADGTNYDASSDVEDMWKIFEHSEIR